MTKDIISILIRNRVINITTVGMPAGVATRELLLHNHSEISCMETLKDKVAVVTGGIQGIEYMTAQIQAEAGATVAITGCYK